jgi:hypothetical protein
MKKQAVSHLPLERFWPGAPFSPTGSVKHPDSGFAQPGNEPFLLQNGL